MSERFYVRESSGYTINPDALTRGSGALVTEVRVVDSAYCHNDVRTFPSRKHATTGSATLERRRLAARELCDSLNLAAAREMET